MRHSSPETKRRYQLGLIHQLREHLERANEKAYHGRDPLNFRDSRDPAEVSQVVEVRNELKMKEKVVRPRGRS
jgi:hypothetical protein